LGIYPKTTPLSCAPKEEFFDALAAAAGSGHSFCQHAQALANNLQTGG
jgi:hypothetical protein